MDVEESKWLYKRKGDNLKVAVLGAGIIGACTVVELKRSRNVSITWIDDRWDETTLSYGPAGIFRPSIAFGGLPRAQVESILKYSCDFYKTLSNTENCGISPIAGYHFSDISKQNVKNQFLENLLPIFREASADELTPFGKEWKYGSYYETFLTKSSSFIPWAVNNFRRNGGITIKRKITDFEQLAGQYDIVFNCSGMGARYLCDDRHMVPIRGQLIKVYAPNLSHFYYEDLDTFVIPLAGQEGHVVLGTVKQYERHDKRIDPYDYQSIMSRCARLYPEITRAKLISQWVGLRPYRYMLRLESEIRPNLRIVHNYGHGGYGILTAPGTARLAVKEFEKLLISGLCKL